MKLRGYLKIWNKNAEDRVRRRNLCMGDLIVFYLPFQGENYVLKSLNQIKSNHWVLRKNVVDT